MGVLLFRHIKYVLKNTGTIDDMGFKEDNHNFNKITNLKLVFKNIFYFLLPIYHQDKYEGYYFDRLGEDPEVNNFKHE